MSKGKLQLFCRNYEADKPEDIEVEVEESEHVFVRIGTFQLQLEATKQGGLQIHAEGLSAANLCVFPVAGNVLEVRAVERW